MRHSLLYRLIIFNACGFAFIVWAWMHGLVDLVLEADPTKITHVIAALFVAGLASLGWRALKVNAAIDGGTPLYTGQLRKRSREAKQMVIRNEHLGDIPEYLVLLGLIGNAVGFLMAFGGVDMSSLGSADGLMAAGTQILAGIGTAFGSTVAGCVLALWAMINYRMLVTATALYVEDMTP